MYFCCLGWYKLHFLFLRNWKNNIDYRFGYCRYFKGASCVWTFNTPFFYTPLELKIWYISSCFIFILYAIFSSQWCLLVFFLDDAKWTEKLSSYFFNFNFKVGHEPWTCVNPLRLANPGNFFKTVRLSNFVHVFFHFHKYFWFVILYLSLVFNFLSFSLLL